MYGYYKETSLVNNFWALKGLSFTLSHLVFFVGGLSLSLLLLSGSFSLLLFSFLDRLGALREKSEI